MRGRSRHYKFSIMSNSGFGNLTIKNNKYKIELPQSLITKDGKVYDRIEKLIQKRDFNRLEKNGVKVLNIEE